jgi:hypothetical protein
VTPATRVPAGAPLATTAPRLIGLESLSRESRLHPALVRRLVSLGLIELSGGSETAPLFRREDAALLARAARLHRDLGIDYAGAVLASELIERIETLERRLRIGAPPQTRREVIAWTRTV